MTRNAMSTGVLLAALAAVAFGVTAPVIAWAGRGVGAFATAALLYVGAALASAIARAFRGATDAPLRRTDAPRVIAVALVGGALAPTLLAFGLQRTGAAIGSLLLNLEAVATVLLARALYREPIGRRVAAAVALMVAGGALLAIGASDGWHAGASLVGVMAVVGATIAWAADNTLTRALAERDPIDVVIAKCGAGAGVTLVAALVAGDPRPGALAAGVLLACGAVGYGVSLRLYLLAQRRIGAGRTGSVFALAPFVGVAVAVALGEPVGAWALAAAPLFLIGVVLHATEKHGHAHRHEPVEHDHVHRHDDGHHAHAHDPPVAGEHAHPHRHDALEHDHEHAPDLHHGHAH